MGKSEENGRLFSGDCHGIIDGDRREETEDNGLENIPCDHDNGTHKSVRERIRHELASLREYTDDLTWEAVKTGEWFTMLLQRFLIKRAQEVSIDRFEQMFPGKTADQIADRLVSKAVGYSAIAGGLAGAGVSAGTLAAMVSAGTGIAINLATLIGEMIYTTRLQIRLVYDLSVLYNHPVDPYDPSDITDVFALATGVKILDVSGKTMFGVVATSAANIHMRRATSAFSKAVRPVVTRAIGLKMTQRALLRTAMPVVGLAIASGWNFFATRAIAKLARARFRAINIIDDEIIRQIEHADVIHGLLLRASIWAAKADGVWDRNEVETIYAIANKIDHEDVAYGEIEDAMNHGPERFFEELSKLTDPAMKDLIMEVMLMTVSVDQKFDRKERAFLKKCAEAMGMDFHIGNAKRRMKKLFA